MVKHSSDFTLKSYLIGTVNLTKNADLDNYKYSGYGTGFDVSGTSLFLILWVL